MVARNGTVLRVLGPNLAALSLGWSGTLNGYLDPYMKQDRQKYTTTDLRIDTQSAWASSRTGSLATLAKTRGDSVGITTLKSSDAAASAPAKPE